MKVVERAGPRRAVVYVCVPPDGRVRIAGSAFDAIPREERFPPEYSIRVLAVSGTWVAITYTSVVDFHGREEIDKVSDARSGRSYRFFEGGILEGPPFDEGESPFEGHIERVLLNRFGQLALALLVNDDILQIVGVEASGAKRVLDSGSSTQIPLGSLTLVGHTVKWQDGAVAHSAAL